MIEGIWIWQKDFVVCASKQYSLKVSISLKFIFKINVEMTITCDFYSTKAWSRTFWQIRFQFVWHPFLLFRINLHLNKKKLIQFKQFFFNENILLSYHFHKHLGSIWGSIISDLTRKIIRCFNFYIYQNTSSRLHPFYMAASSNYMMHLF